MASTRGKNVWETLSNAPTTPFINAAKARSKWENGNITYNFGHYGTHIATALRFVSSVKSYLENAQKENSDN